MRTLTHSCIPRFTNPESSTLYFLIRTVPEEGDEKWEIIKIQISKTPKTRNFKKELEDSTSCGEYEWHCSSRLCTYVHRYQVDIEITVGKVSIFSSLFPSDLSRMWRKQDYCVFRSRSVVRMTISLRACGYTRGSYSKRLRDIRNSPRSMRLFFPFDTCTCPFPSLIAL